ncbi:acetylesterase [Arthrobacter sp. 24S4-2]|uniref:dienelactone hydrolase family protein n=1 Tax=Arthrobacter sp. 24S4-2 TaxID=2575374 RepID=UPI0010C7B8F7|nr:dienelactone hydrolase family protein [Arthrobacter sp. 24S4-2]QCO99748.1 acetylesterase [Arthrobacter sp. 24S4-2]
MNSGSTDAAPRPSAIGGYEDWPAYIRSHPRHIADALGVPDVPAHPNAVLESEETHDGVTTSRVSWQLGFGPRTRAWFLRPAGVTGPLPGVLALHCHAGIKSRGADRLVDARLVDPRLVKANPVGDNLVHPRLQAATPVEADPVNANLPDRHTSTGPLSGDRAAAAAISALQRRLYGGRPLATWLASQGFAVLAHDTFSWGSRRFDLSTPPWRTSAVVEGRKALWREAGVVPSEADLYDAAAATHEDTVAKAAGVLGTSYAGMVAHDDLAALRVLAGLPGVDGKRVGSIGFSGGGGRSLTLAALSPLVRSFVVTCMMTTYRSLFPSYLDAHSWLLQTPGLGRLGEYPELAARSAADTFLVQYALADELYPEAGMRDADAILRAQTVAGRYSGSFWPGGHAFVTDMQVEAAGFLQQSLSPNPRVFARQNGHS